MLFDDYPAMYNIVATYRNMGLSKHDNYDTTGDVHYEDYQMEYNDPSAPVMPIHEVGAPCASVGPVEWLQDNCEGVQKFHFASAFAETTINALEDRELNTTYLISSNLPVDKTDKPRKFWQGAKLPILPQQPRQLKRENSETNSKIHVPPSRKGKQTSITRNLPTIKSRLGGCFNAPCPSGCGKEFSCMKDAKRHARTARSCRARKDSAPDWIKCWVCTRPISTRMDAVVRHIHDVHGIVEH